MADLSITAANVLNSGGGGVAQGTAGASITAGQTVYLDSATTTIKLADANLSSAASTVVGIALHAASSGQPILYQTDGVITLGSVLTAGLIYVNSATAGAIAPSADLTSTWRTSILGVALTSSTLKLNIVNSDTALS